MTALERLVAYRRKPAAPRWALSMGRVGLAGLSLVALGLSTVLALFVDRPLSGEEPPLFNPAYEYAHTGHLTFPDYAFFWGPRMYDTFAAHPPAHYILVGLSLRLGLGIRFAEALPILVTLTLALAVVAASRLSLATRIGAAFGLAATVATAVQFFPDSSFAARPELHVAVTWLAGMFALEAGRRRDWNLGWLFFGASLLTLASAMQWFAMFSWLGAAAYGVAVVRERGWPRARPAVAALLVGLLIFGLPYIVVYIIPNWDVIERLRNAGWSGGLWSLWKYNYNVYAATRSLLWQAARGPMRWTLGAPALALATRLPGFLIGEALLFVRRETRLLALAASPLFAWTFLFTLGKSYYILPELLVVTFAATSLVVAAAQRVSGALGGPAAVVITGAAAAGLLAWAAIAGTPEAANAVYRYGPLPTPLEVDRAAALRIVGPDALLTSQHQLWYMGGGRYWHDFNPDLIERYDLDPQAYFRQFEYVADIPTLFFNPSQLHVDYPRQTVAFSEYALHRLSLAGFVGDSDSYGFTVFRPGNQGPVRGYVRIGATLYQFRSATSGSSVLVTLVCPLSDDGTGAIPLTPSLARGATGPELHFPIAEAYVPAPPRTPAGSPAPTSTAPLHSIAGVVLPEKRFAAERTTIVGDCRVRDLVRGSVSTLSAYTLGESLTSHQQLVAIYRTAPEAVAAKRSGRLSR